MAGPPPLVDAVKRKSRAASARCYADPFLPNAQPLSLIDRVMAMLRKPASAHTDLSPRPAAAVAAVPAARGASAAGLGRNSAVARRGSAPHAARLALSV